MTILCLGLNHRTTPLAFREAFAIPSSIAQDALAQVMASPAIDEAAVLSTCNRMEWYLAASDAPRAEAFLRAWLLEQTGFSQAQLDAYLYRFEDQAAVQHLLRVASGLDSMVLGEPQILGQVRDAYELGLAAQGIGPKLAELFRTAIKTGKQARTDTCISRNATSIGSVAMRWIEDHFATSASRRVVVVGAGEMGALVARHAVNLPGVTLRILNRTLARAQSLAKAVGAKAQPLAELTEALTWADAVIVAATGPDYLIRPDHLPQRTAPLLLVDLAVPRAIHPALSQHPRVQLFVLDDIQQVVQRNLAQREAAIPQVEAIIAENARKYMARLNQREVLPVLVDMRRKVNELARMELEQALHKLPVDDPAIADQMSRLAHRLANKFLHDPTIRLKAQAAQGNAEPYARALQELFLGDWQGSSR